MLKPKKKKREKGTSQATILPHKHKESNDEFADNENYGKVWHHCHYTGNYRGATCNICNLRNKTLKEIPVVLHNGSNFNFHFIIT